MDAVFYDQAMPNRLWVEISGQYPNPGLWKAYDVSNASNPVTVLAPVPVPGKFLHTNMFICMLYMYGGAKCLCSWI